MHARTGTLEVDPSKIDDAVRQIETKQIPRYRETDGYKGFTILADRSDGTVMGISFWDSEEALKASEELGQEARSQAAETGGATGEPAVGRYEVLFDDMV